VLFDTLCVSFSFVFLNFLFVFEAAIYANKNVYINTNKAKAAMKSTMIRMTAQAYHK